VLTQLGVLTFEFLLLPTRRPLPALDFPPSLALLVPLHRALPAFLLSLRAGLANRTRHGTHPFTVVFRGTSITFRDGLLQDGLHRRKQASWFPLLAKFHRKAWVSKDPLTWPLVLSAGHLCASCERRCLHSVAPGFRFRRARSAICSLASIRTARLEAAQVTCNLTVMRRKPPRRARAVRASESRRDRSVLQNESAPRYRPASRFTLGSVAPMPVRYSDGRPPL
jgi:hypothetical protein